MLKRWIEAVDVLVVTVNVGSHCLVQVVPPTALRDEPAVRNEAEPWREEKSFVVHHLKKLRLGHPFDVVDLIRVALDSEVALRGYSQEEDVINLVLSPGTLLLKNEEVSEIEKEGGENHALY